jgi:phospholipase/lecithinase/hemolysin
MQNPIYTKLIVFGDGLSDQGRFGPLTQYRYPPSPPFFEGRWTNGPTWVELLATEVGIPLHADDNWAQGGATTGYFNINEPLRQALGLAASAPIRGVLQQVDDVLTSTPQLDPHALYILWAGGHDFGAYLDFGQPDVKAYPPEANIKQAIQTLATGGAKHFLIGNMPDLASTPAYAGTDKAPLAKALVESYNTGLQKIARDMRAEGLNILEFDGATVFTEIAMNPASYGINYVTEAYLPYNIIDFNNPLAPVKPLPEERKGQNPDEFMSFWAVSAGSKVHRALAKRAGQLIYDSQKKL